MAVRQGEEEDDDRVRAVAADKGEVAARKKS